MSRRRLPPSISGDALEVEVDLPRPAPAARTLGPSGTAAIAVDKLVCAALDVLDTRLTDEQRYLADQIYELCNSLEATL